MRFSSSHDGTTPIAAYRTVLEKAPPLSAINLQIAAAYRNKKDYAAATSAYDAVLKADPGNQKAAIGIATMNLERGDNKAAEDALMKAAQGAGAEPGGASSASARSRSRETMPTKRRGGTRRPPPPIPTGASRSTSSAFSQ